MPLTDVSIRAAKPREKSYRLKDSVGLYLEVRPEGGKWWRYRYKIAGRENMLSLGTYPKSACPLHARGAMSYAGRSRKA